MNTNYLFTIQRIKQSYENEEKHHPSNKYIVLYRAIKKCIISIELPHQWTLPSTRVLANEISLSRTTIVKSYELLLLEKLIESKQGSGYIVNFEASTTKENSAPLNALDGSLYPDISSKGKSFLLNISLINRVTDGKGVAFRPGLPPLDIFPINRWKNLLNTYWRHTKSSGLSYARSTGIEPLKRSIANYLNISRNIKCDHQQIIVVSGSLQSLYLIANVLIDKGDNVILENPAFPNVHSIFKSMQANLLPIRLDKEGIDIEKMNELSHLNPKLVHVTPSNHYPLGIKMSLKRRKELLAWASKNKTLIIENDYENEIANNQQQVPSIFSLDTEDRTIYVGTFNRLLHPSIRLGYMVVPKYLIGAVEALQEHSHRFVAPSIQVVMNQFIERNYLYQHLKNITEAAEERHGLFVKHFQENTDTMYLENTSFSSLHVLAKPYAPMDSNQESELIEKLAKKGITTHALGKCFIGNEKQQGLILGYSSVRPTTLIKTVKKMTQILQK
jgi:GntR family transcriptional regulator/MocR family aminotransferase